MPRRIKNSLADDMFEMLLDTPAWIGLAIPIGIYSLARWIAPWLLLPKDETAQTAVIGLQLGKISVQIAPYVGLFFFGMWAIAQVVRFTRRLEHAPRAPQVAQSKSPSSPASTVPPTLCPKCGAAMVRRIAKTGPNAGNPFLGCSRYPACRAIEPIATGG